MVCPTSVQLICTPFLLVSPSYINLSPPLTAALPPSSSSSSLPSLDPYFSSSSTPSPSSFAIFESLTLSLVDATSHLHMVVRVVVADVNESAQAECKEPDKCESWHWVPWSDIQILSKAQSPSTGSSSSSSGPVTFSPGSPFKSSDKIFAPLRLLSRSPWTPFNARPDAPMLPVDEVEAELREEEERRAAARIAEETKQAMSTSTSTTTASNQGDHPSHNRSSGSSDAVGHPISQDQHASTSSSHVKDST